MSLPTAREPDGEPDKPCEPQQPAEVEAISSSSSSWRRNANNNNPVMAQKRSKVEESDEDLLTVPDVEATTNIANSMGNTNTTNNNNPDVQPEKRRRGQNPVDKEYRRLKRLLRNRVSAQQARERKKVYVNDLESRAKELQDQNSKLEERISTLINENTMLRKVLMNTRPKTDESIIDPNQDRHP